MTLSASFLHKTSYNFTETAGNNVIVDSDSVTSNVSFTSGTGIFQANAGVKNAGVLPPSGSVTYDLSNMTKSFLGLTSVVALSGVKTIEVMNTSTTRGWDIAVAATGVNPLTDLFNGGSGVLIIKPGCSFGYTDPYGDLLVTPSAKNVSVIDVGGSGASYSILVLGTLG